ncbi:hypothetical protein BpHYR1_033735 [Brachionus plicatilis]|uniref:Uncharacterized protein n=1 Tax=Brachionus plicatilis TaxID=10195 RepID=A0A3M7RMX2_BRAPC|nr:hypothetical protein BpHYR1_033735 [Brachionus plicatilis]
MSAELFVLVHSTHHTGLLAASGLSIFNFSSPFLSRICTVPLKNPKAKYWPSLLHAQHVIREKTFVLGTYFSLDDQRPKSLTAHRKTYWKRNIPSNSVVQMITVLSAPPEANKLPSFA